jgi:hypothetical protein
MVFEKVVHAVTATADVDAHRAAKGKQSMPD